MIHISGTSALVLLWGGKEAYKSNLAQLYLENLDLSAGLELYNECSKIWKPYFEIIRNRKFGVFKFLESILSIDQNYQVIVLAAGIAPLSLDIIEKFPDAKVFDVDIENMKLKEELYEELGVNKNVKFLECDITDKKGFKNSLVQTGWDEKKKSIVVAEGISYYLSEDELWNTFSLFQSNDKSNFIILESRLPYDKVAHDRKEIQERVWDYLTSSLDLKYVTRYYDEKVKEYGDKIGAEVLEKYTMKNIQQMRDGNTELFPEDNSGWIEVRKLNV